MIYPAFTQHKECGPYTITVSMNLDSWQLFQFACERYCFERERIVNDIADAEKMRKSIQELVHALMQTVGRTSERYPCLDFPYTSERKRLTSERAWAFSH